MQLDVEVSPPACYIGIQSSDRLTDRGQCIVAHFRWAENSNTGMEMAMHLRRQHTVKF